MQTAESVKPTEHQQSHVDIIQSYTELIKQAINLCVPKGPLYHTRPNQTINSWTTPQRQVNLYTSIVLFTDGTQMQ